MKGIASMFISDFVTDGIIFVVAVIVFGFIFAWVGKELHR